MNSRSPYEVVVEDAADFAGPGLRKPRAIVVWGVIIPLMLLYVGVDAWRSGIASLLWTEVELKDSAAKAMGMAYAAVGGGDEWEELLGCAGI